MDMLTSICSDEALNGAKILAKCACHGPFDKDSEEPSVCLAPASYRSALLLLLYFLRRTKGMIEVFSSYINDRLDINRKIFVYIGKAIVDIVAAAQASPKGLAEHDIIQVSRKAYLFVEYCSDPNKDVEGARILLKSLAQLVAAHPILRDKALPGLESALTVCDGNPFLKRTVGLVREYLARLASTD